MRKIKIGPEIMWTSENIKEMLATNDAAVLKALVTLYKYQLPEERNLMAATVENGVGFNKVDAPYLTYMATKAKNNQGLKVKDIQIVRPIIMKYSGQLAKIANDKLNVQMEWKI